jgi:hypothetical protein
VIAATYWLSQNCIRNPRISGGVVVLLRHMNVWLRGQGQPECSLEELTGVLEDKGFRVIEVAGTLLVPGMGLAEDWRGKPVQQGRPPQAEQRVLPL